MSRMSFHRRQTSTTSLAVLATMAGIATFSAMDAVMKNAALAAGVYTPLLLRNTFGVVLSLPLWLAGTRPPPRPGAVKVHVQRSVLTAAMAVLFFYGLVRIPLAEGIAISFIAPILALYIAALMLKERIRAAAIQASLLGFVGVVVIAAGRFRAEAVDQEAARGIAAILVSAVLYAINLVLQRKQALLAGPAEIALFQSLFVALVMAPFGFWFFQMPGLAVLAQIALGAVLATAALLFLAWGYARAEAQVLVPVEYTGFLWAALFGWLVFAETVTLATLAGAVLIVAGCWLASKPSDKLV